MSKYVNIIYFTEKKTCYMCSCYVLAYSFVKVQNITSLE